MVPIDAKDAHIVWIDAGIAVTKCGHSTGIYETIKWGDTCPYCGAELNVKADKEDSNGAVQKG